MIRGVITLLVLFTRPATDLYWCEPSVVLSVYVVFFSTSCVVTTTSSRLDLPSIQACHFNKRQFDIRSWFASDPISLTDSTYISSSAYVRYKMGVFADNCDILHQFCPARDSLKLNCADRLLVCADGVATLGVGYVLCS